MNDTLYDKLIQIINKEGGGAATPNTFYNEFLLYAAKMLAAPKLGETVPLQRQHERALLLDVLRLQEATEDYRKQPLITREKYYRTRYETVASIISKAKYLRDIDNYVGEFLTPEESTPSRASKSSKKTKKTKAKATKKRGRKT